MAFYVSGQAQYTISPEVPSAIVWDGAWHHIIGSYDGGVVRMWVDGSPVGAGTRVSMAIDYTNGSKGIYIGTYRGSCDLGFHGAIDDVAVWDDRPAEATTGPGDRSRCPTRRRPSRSRPAPAGRPGARWRPRRSRTAACA